jgi:hypothetical protein
MPVEECREIAKTAFRRMNAEVMEFVNEMAGWENLPEAFDVCSDGWNAAEREIEVLAGDGDVARTSAACERYLVRVRAFLAKWRAWAAEQKQESLFAESKIANREHANV